MKTLALTISAFLFSASTFANYNVPGVPADSANYALDVVIHQDGLQFATEFTLPLDLTGAKNVISAKGEMVSETTAVLTADNAQMTCDMKTLICQAVYQGLVFDHDQIHANLVAQDLSAEAIDARMSVSRIFEGDPIGVFSFKLSK